MAHSSCWGDNRRVSLDRSESAALAALSRVVRRRRESAKMTQEDAAHEADLSLRHYQSLEGGRLNASFVTILRVCRALGMAPHELIREFEQEHSGRRKRS